jgi:hypothetical protein
MRPPAKGPNVGPISPGMATKLMARTSSDLANVSNQSEATDRHHHRPAAALKKAAGDEHGRPGLPTFRQVPNNCAAFRQPSFDLMRGHISLCSRPRSWAAARAESPPSASSFRVGRHSVTIRWTSGYTYTFLVAELGLGATAFGKSCCRKTCDYRVFPMVQTNF